MVDGTVVDGSTVVVVETIDVVSAAVVVEAVDIGSAVVVDETVVEGSFIMAVGAVVVGSVGVFDSIDDVSFDTFALGVCIIGSELVPNLLAASTIRLSAVFMVKFKPSKISGKGSSLGSVFVGLVVVVVVTAAVG